jgi:hypothetical protein
VFLPSVPHLLELASEMEAQRDHILGARKDPDGPRRRAARARAASRGCRGELEKRFEALSATGRADQVIFDGASFGTGARSGTPEEEEYLGPARPAEPPDQVTVLLNKRQRTKLAAQSSQAGR